ncbi:agenet domain-containing protein [Tanacetum coccineum]
MTKGKSKKKKAKNDVFTVYFNSGGIFTSCPLLYAQGQIKKVNDTNFDEMSRCAAFENGISESFNKAILGPRHKPIITMLEEIRLYIMQRLVAMNKIAFNLEDRITSSIRKRLKILKEKQRDWIVFLSGFQELKVRKGDQSYGVNMQNKVCQCRLWELSGVCCVHAVATYMHVGIDLDLGVIFCYSQESWFNAYQFSIKLVFGSNMWKRTNDVSPKPPLLRKMLGRPQKARIKPLMKLVEPIGSRLGGIGEASGSGGRGGRTSSRGGGMGSRDGRRGSRGGGNTRGGRMVGGMAGSSSMGVLTAEEKYQLDLNEQAFRECMEEQAREQAKIDVEQERLDEKRREEHEWEENIHSQPTQKSGVWVKDTTITTSDIDEAPTLETSGTTDLGEGKATLIVEDVSAPVVDTGKAK